MARKVLELGKIAYSSAVGRKINAVTLEWELKDGRFTMSGNIYNRPRTDILACGQNCEEIGKFFRSNAKVQRMIAIWRTYHLNDMQAGTPVQMAAIKKLKGPKGYDAAVTHLKSVGLYIDNGYQYGSAWLKLEIPADIVAEIEAW